MSADYRSYTNATGATGGGYMAGSHQEGDSSSFAPKKTQHTLRPVTIKQLLKTSETHADGDFKLDGQELNQIKLVAAVRNVDKQTTMTTFKLEDGTGTIDAKLFANVDEAELEPLSAIVAGAYVRVIGQLKSYRERNYFINLFNFQSIQVINDPNEITTHNLEVIHVHVSTTRTKLHNPHQDVTMAAAAPYHPAPSAASAQNNDAILNKVHEALSEAPDHNVGLHRTEIFNKIGGLPGGQSRLDQILKQLMEEGAIYTTTNDDHFANTY